MDPHLAGRTARLLEPLHALGYFAPEVDAEVSGLGVRKGRATYFASRSAAMGRVGAGPVAATFYVFNPSLVAHFIPAAWDAASPEDVVAARYRGVSAAWSRLLGDEVLASADVAGGGRPGAYGLRGLRGRGPSALRGARRPGLAGRAPHGALPRPHAAARAPRRRARRGADRGRPRAGSRHSSRTPPPAGASPGRPRRRPAPGPTRSGQPRLPASPSAAS